MRSFILVMLLLFLAVLLCHSQSLPKHLKIAESYVGTREATGNNDGPKIEYIIRRGHGAPNSSYCAFFITLCLDSAKVKYPKIRSGMARDFKIKGSIPAKDVLIGKVKIPPGTIIIWQNGKTIHGHAGFVRKWYKQYGLTVEGNTSGGATGSQSNGDGIWNKSRSIEPANYFRITTFTLVTY